ncbi:MAG TPA: sigma-70 family RNA polymerase sigma factor [Acidimicrobiales bacterium]|nr:sigma-70 family RNA polymerase sigma factor [Acidimicrobiales bacterium]
MASRGARSRGLPEGASDTALMMEVSRSNEAALEAIYRRHGGAVYGLANRMLSENGIAEEITQEIFLRLWQEPARFDPERGSLRTFLLTSAHSRAVDKIRADTARRRREDRDHREDPGRDRVTPLEDEVASLIVGDEVRAAVEGLPADEREAIGLAYFGGYSYRQVAEMLGTPEGTVKSRIRHGMQSLRALLAQSTGVEEGSAT